MRKQSFGTSGLNNNPNMLKFSFKKRFENILLCNFNSKINIFRKFNLPPVKSKHNA